MKTAYIYESRFTDGRDNHTICSIDAIESKAYEAAVIELRGEDLGGYGCDEHVTAELVGSLDAGTLLEDLQRATE